VRKVNPVAGILKLLFVRSRAIDDLVKPANVEELVTRIQRKLLPRRSHCEMPAGSV
jgi:hypothetical protein